MEPLPLSKPTSIMANQEASLSEQDQYDSKQNQEPSFVEQKRKTDRTDHVYYQGFYFPSDTIPNILAFKQHFKPQDKDIIVATKPKSGTTWLNSLVYSIVNRTRFTSSNHPLLTKHPHELVLSFEYNIYSLAKRSDEEASLLLSSMTFPRLFSTHLPYDILPESIKSGQSKCKIVYMARNPLDTLVSYWKFIMRNYPWVEEELSLEDFVERFCKGEEAFGPLWDHVLGYWKESLEKSNNVLFLKYEDMQEDGVSEMKKLADFLGCGFSKEEESEGVIQKILRLCSIESLKNLDVNKTGTLDILDFHKDSFFRKGKVGDWVNHLNPSMVEKLKQVMREKFVGSGLEFKMYP